MKRSELAFAFLLLPLDILMILISFILAYKLQAQRVELSFLWTFDDFIKFVAALIPIWLAIFALEGLYNTKRRRQGLDEFSGIVLAVSASVMVVMAWFFLSKTIFFSRAIVLYAWVLAIVLVTLSRLSIKALQKYLYRFGIGIRRLAIIGDNGLTEDILREIQSNRDLGYKFIGLIKSSENKKNKNNCKILGEIEEIEKIIKTTSVDDIILADTSLGEKKVSSIIDFCQSNRIGIKQIPNFFQVQTTNVGLTALAGIPIVEFRITPLEGWGRIIKRLTDIVGSILGIIIFSPLMIITALLIKLDSKGPIIYKNERVGENGRRFFLYKFRSMKCEYCTGDGYGGKEAEEYEKKLIEERNERDGPVYKVLRDPRRTRFGRFIEKTSLDEFPQFFNVIKGDISLVGPRPHQPREVKKYEKWQTKVLRIKPGVTGMAQISGRSDLNFSDEARLDIYYIENWSLWMDLKILLKTPLSLLKPRKGV